MVVISVEVPEFIAKKFASYKVINSEVLYKELYNTIFIDFWKKWIWKKDFEEYLSIKNSL